jgi:hypothetical protein
MFDRAFSVGVKTGLDGQFGGDWRTGVQHAQRPIDFRAPKRRRSDESAKRVIAAKSPSKLPVREQRGIQPRKRAVDAQLAANQVFVTSGINAWRQPRLSSKSLQREKIS